MPGTANRGTSPGNSRIQATADAAPSLRTTLDAVETTWKATFPGNPFTYFFLDDDFDQQYRADERFGEIAGLFALLAVLVAGLGLFGLSSFVLLQRMKEIGVRKVLGALVTEYREGARQNVKDG